jgi:hypothetical protein
MARSVIHVNVSSPLRGMEMMDGLVRASRAVPG